MDHQLLLPVSGLLVGILVGLTGIGGGVLMTPLLLMLGLPPTAAVGTDLAYSAFTKLAGTVQHGRQGTIDWRVVRTLALGSIPFTVLAVWLLSLVHGGPAALVLEDRLKQVIGVMLVVASALLLRKVLVPPPALPAHGGGASGLAGFPTWKILVVGAVGGFLVGMTSIGSGSLIIALLVMVITLRPSVLVGTDIAHAFLLVTAGALAHQLFLQDVQMGVAGMLLIGSIPGVLIGSRMSTWVPRRPLQIGLAGLLLTSAWTLLR